ncbi:FmdB family zinc ribbon protein [Actinotalea sp. JY-7876]|uniref:FmdB family zinc ribbon protein n=1 Tax=Actinotalea sp. JY-7876 TaxID=2758442 RepID=UPI0015F37A04|nr:FmdB family zinc ribbon protein [Actinotalea sp. JY-7876]
MPTYSYACTACEHRFDAQQAFTDDALTQCPQCQGRLRKLFGNVGVVFKGSGFYRTDARAETGAKKKASSSSSSGSDGASGGNGSSGTSTAAPAPAASGAGGSGGSGSSGGATTSTASTTSSTTSTAPAAG